jgi:hypothetical protein
MVMKHMSPLKREYRVVAAGLFKATCLRLLDEVYENKNLAILVTKRGRLLGQLLAPPEGIKLTGPTVQEDTSAGGDISALQAEAREAFEEHRKKKKDKKKRKK